MIDADGLVLGRLAREVAGLLRGKHRAYFAPHLDTGDAVIVINAAKIEMTATKAATKTGVYRHSGYPGGLRSTTYADAAGDTGPRTSSSAPCAGWSRTRTARSPPDAGKLKVYAGPEHPHAAQQPDAARHRRRSAGA